MARVAERVEELAGGEDVQADGGEVFVLRPDREVELDSSPRMNAGDSRSGSDRIGLLLSGGGRPVVLEIEVQGARQVREGGRLVGAEDAGHRRADGPGPLFDDTPGEREPPLVT